MPYKSEKQARLMRAVAHSPEFAKKVGISQSVGRKFEEHKAEGGTVKESEMKRVFAGKETPAEERKEKAAAKKAGMTYKAAERKFEGEKYCGGGKAKGYAEGGDVGPGRGFVNPATVAQRNLADKSWAQLRKLKDSVEDAMIMDRSKIASAKKKYDDAAPSLRKQISNVREQTSYEPEGLPRTYAKGGKAKGYAKGGETSGYPRRVNPGLTPDLPDSEAQVRGKKRAMPPIPGRKPRPINPGVTPDLADSDAQMQGLKKGGSVRGAGIAKRGFGCMGKK